MRRIRQTRYPTPRVVAARLPAPEPLARRLLPALAWAVAALLLALGAGRAFAAPAAHHGWSGYDSSTLLALSGTIREVQYGPPHVVIALEVPAEPEEDGSIVDPPMLLTVVLAPPARSEFRGMPREMIAEGAEATVEGYLHRTDTLELRAERIRIGEVGVELR